MSDPRIDQIREWRQSVPTRDELEQQAETLRQQLAEIEAQIVPAWTQPQGAHDAYPLGARVFHAGRSWTSAVAANVWEPGVHGWE